ncbi:ABC transporter permease [Corynebacterium canis]|uniref:ABC transporter permease n=1 Tax=Corynebacterium canis TaxID=679663 RepID=A0A5C5UL91_9CORY|nr:ABC transporter permease [Corynebacterium canis]TWT26609.1 ABC transporter permease [Corynebacterium canis]WJY76391.1 Carnitine transport permease protein OpuCB [Corynebacterium canis]
MTWVTSNSEYLRTLTWAHVHLSWPPILMSFLLAVPLGWWAHRSKRVREVLVVGTGLMYAIPSLALFVVLPQFLGTSILSPWNVIVAMAIYGLALQVRSTADAFDAIDSDVSDAATAMGYSTWRKLFAVEIPLALPVMISGLRVVSASTISLVSVGALIGVNSLGTLFTDGFNRYFPTEILVGILGTLALAIIFDLALVLIQRVSTPWARGVKRRA